ncbi:unnamed protein product [Nezara viridula]|uniref:Uncharacterized protein n=1 Tax=Nezara viridula TaxID=85310 RepID=A0A9P0H0E2_NEZVI|nr:unnamed protein product [Nezara viridula]
MIGRSFTPVISCKLIGLREALAMAMNIGGISRDNSGAVEHGQLSAIDHRRGRLWPLIPTALLLTVSSSLLPLFRKVSFTCVNCTELERLAIAGPLIVMSQ